MRLFVALDVDNDIRVRIESYIEAMRGFAPDARWVRPESLHLTLKFIGEKPAGTVEEVQYALSALRAESFPVAFRGYGFFPSATAPRVFWLGVDAGPRLAALATAVDEALEALGIAREEHTLTPHLTLARAGGRSGAPHTQKGDAPNRRFRRLHEKLSAMPIHDFGSMTAREFFLFESHLGKGGSRYVKLARFELAG